MLCADLIEIEWKDKSGHIHQALANLEDISNSGACLQLDTPVPYETIVRLEHANTEMEGYVRYCVFRETGYFLGVQFAPGSRWTQRRFHPQHMLDPRRLMAQPPKRASGRKAAAQKPPGPVQ